MQLAAGWHEDRPGRCILIGNETGPGEDDALAAGKRFGNGQFTEVYGVGEERHQGQHVHHAGTLLRSSESGPGLTAKLLAHLRHAHYRGSSEEQQLRFVGFDVDGTLVERYVRDESNPRTFIHPTLERYPELMKELVGLAGMGVPFGLFTRNEHPSVAERVLLPFARTLSRKELPVGGFEVPVFSTVQTVLHKVFIDPRSERTTFTQDVAWGREYRISDEVLKRIVNVLKQEGGPLVQARFQNRALANGDTSSENEDDARTFAGIDSKVAIPELIYRPGSHDTRVLVINPLANATRRDFVDQLVDATAD